MKAAEAVVAVEAVGAGEQVEAVEAVKWEGGSAGSAGSGGQGGWRQRRQRGERRQSRQYSQWRLRKGQGSRGIGGGASMDVGVLEVVDVEVVLVLVFGVCVHDYRVIAGVGDANDDNDVLDGYGSFG